MLSTAEETAEKMADVNQHQVTFYLNVNILKIKLRLLCPMEIDLSIFVFYVVLHVRYQTDFYSLKIFFNVVVND